MSLLLFDLTLFWNSLSLPFCWRLRWHYFRRSHYLADHVIQLDTSDTCFSLGRAADRSALSSGYVTFRNFLLSSNFSDYFRDSWSCISSYWMCIVWSALQTSQSRLLIFMAWSRTFALSRAFRGTHW